MKYASIPLVLAFFGLTAAQAASAPTPPANLVVCSRMSDPGERLKCYDTQMAGMLAATSPPAATAPAVVAASKTEPAAVAASPKPNATPAAAPTAEQKFGAEDLAPAARTKVDQPDTVLLSRITSIREVRPKLWIIVLANGQIWLQEGTQATVFFHAGYDARIDKALFGAYRMSTTQTGEKNWVKVTRIQ